MTQAQLHTALAGAAEAEYAAFSSKLLGGAQKPLLGVRLPALRRLAAQLVRENGGAALSLCTRGQYFEDVMLKGMVLGRLPAPLDAVLAETRAFLDEIDNWSVCDSFCAGYLHAKKHPAEVFAFAKGCLADTREFAARFGIVLLMDHFRCTPYAAEALRAISAVDAAGRYYVQMGAAWALATFYLQLPQEVMRLLRTHPDDAVCRMAVRKLCESLRVPAGAKAQAKQIWKERKGV